MADKIDITINPDDFTLGDLEDFAAYVGVELHDAARPVPVYDDEGNRLFDDRGRPLSQTRLSSKALTALVWLVRRAQEPTFGIEDARNTRVGALEISYGDTSNRGNG